MTWIDNNGEVRPQDWNEYCEMLEVPPRWMRSPAPPKFTYRYESENNRGLRLRVRLHRSDPRCFWCGRKTELDAAHADPVLATVDHLYSRLHPQRVGKHSRYENVLHVLACYQCNHERGTRENQGQLFIPKLPERLSFARLCDATLARRGPVAARLTRPVATRSALCTLEEAVKFARENPSR